MGTPGQALRPSLLVHVCRQMVPRHRAFSAWIDSSYWRPARTSAAPAGSVSLRCSRLRRAARRWHVLLWYFCTHSRASTPPLHPAQRWYSLRSSLSATTQDGHHSARSARIDQDRAARAAMIHPGQQRRGVGFLVLGLVRHRLLQHRSRLPEAPTLQEVASDLREQFAGFSGIPRVFLVL